MLDQFYIRHDVFSPVRSFVGELKANGDLGTEVAESIESEMLVLEQMRQISFEQWWHVLDDLCELIPMDAIALSIAKYVRLEQLGILGHLVNYSENLIQSTSYFQRFQPLLHDGGGMDVSIKAFSDQSNHLVINWPEDGGIYHAVSNELLLASISVLMKSVLDEAGLSQVCFTHPKPKDVSEYESFFGCEVKFEERRLGVAIPMDLTALPFKNTNSNLHAQLIKDVEREFSSVSVQSLEFRQLVYDRTFRSLLEGNPTAASVSEKLGVSSRTLHRNLKREGLVFRDVLRSTRMQLARTLLNDKKLPISHIGLMLGYSEESAFSHAFRSWFNTSPAKFRRGR